MEEKKRMLYQIRTESESRIPMIVEGTLHHAPRRTVGMAGTAPSPKGTCEARHVSLRRSKFGGASSVDVSIDGWPPAHQLDVQIEVAEVQRDNCRQLDLQETEARGIPERKHQAGRDQDPAGPDDDRLAVKEILRSRAA